VPAEPFPARIVLERYVRRLDSDLDVTCEFTGTRVRLPAEPDCDADHCTRRNFDTET
jgi:hypothetical protein